MPFHKDSFKEEQSSDISAIAAIEPSLIHPVVSSRRRLQNREAQRRYREKAKQKMVTIEADPSAVIEWPNTMSWDLELRRQTNQEVASFPGDMTAIHQQAFTQELLAHSSSTSSSSPNSWYAKSDRSLPPSDAVLPLDLDDFDEYFENYFDGQPIAGDFRISSRSSVAMAANQSTYSAPSLSMSPPPSTTVPNFGSASSIRSREQSSSHDYTAPHEYGVFSDQFNSTTRDSSRRTSTDTFSTSAESVQSDAVLPLLHVAVQSRNRTMLAMLLQRSAASINERDGRGSTALHAASEMGDRGMVACLLRHGADHRVRNVRDQDALYLAVLAGHTDIAEMLLEKLNMEM